MPKQFQVDWPNHAMIVTRNHFCHQKGQNLCPFVAIISLMIIWAGIIKAFYNTRTGKREPFAIAPMIPAAKICISGLFKANARVKLLWFSDFASLSCDSISEIEPMEDLRHRFEYKSQIVEIQYSKQCLMRLDIIFWLIMSFHEKTQHCRYIYSWKRLTVFKISFCMKMRIFASYSTISTLMAPHVISWKTQHCKYTYPGNRLMMFKISFCMKMKVFASYSTISTQITNGSPWSLSM